MSIFLIGYDLNKPRGEQDYPKLIDAIEALSGTWWHNLDSTWLVKTDSTAVAIRDSLAEHLDDGDELLVLLLDLDQWACTGFSEEATNWLVAELGT